VEQVIQLIGAVLILVGFVLAQFKVWSPQSLPYLLANLFGAAALAATAYVAEQWGFVLLEGVWAIVSAWSLVQLARGVPPPVAH
jgi:hypothetical protein